jgi:L,D-peptidoglycan transpeptidase YkuD (ErfK/YbiS/YcfS/YnhG family)
MDVIVSSDGHLRWSGRTLPCILGRSGVVMDKAEGDGGTPIGCFPVRRVFYRPDRGDAPVTALAVTALSPVHGWCDDSSHPDYNREVRLPHPARTEALWRDDSVYDIIVVLGHNDDPVVPGAGSAIFLHLCHDDGRATEGCVALPRADLLALLRDLHPGDRLCVVDKPQ